MGGAAIGPGRTVEHGVSEGPGGSAERGRSVRHRAETDPGGIALVDGDGALSWAEVADVLPRLAASLLRVAGGPGERVAVLGDNASATLLAHAAGILAGVGTVATARQLRPAEMVDQFRDAGVTAVVTGVAGAPAAAEAVKTLGLRALAVHGRDDPTWSQWTTGAAATIPAADRSARPPLVYTSGTTGRARGTEVRWAEPPASSSGSGSSAEEPGEFSAAEFTAAEYAAALAAADPFPAGPHLVCGPLQHNGPLTSLRHLLAGEPVVILPSFDAGECLRTIERHRVSSTLMVPTHFQRLLALLESEPEARERYDVSSLRSVVHTGSACRADVKRAMIDWFGPVLVESYGASELGTVARISSPEWLAHPESVGRAVPPFEILVLDEHGQPCPAGVQGRIAVRAPEGRGVRYHADPEKSAKAMTAPGVYTLGDLGHLDADGFLFVTGRESDMVISGGVNLYPAESEAVLRRTPGVADVAVIGVPHADLGEAMLALVVAEKGRTPDLGELERACRDALAGYKCPKAYEIVDDLPRNAMGKVDKKVLRARYR